MHIKSERMIDLPSIRPSVDLRNNYSEISRICKEQMEPVFITKNGHGDLAVMNMELYHKLAGKNELYKLIDEGMEDVKNGRVKPYKEAITDLKQRITAQ